MTYSIIEPPVTLRFEEMSRQELEAYGRWFHESAPLRITELSQAVRSTGGVLDWQADASVQSLEVLGEWFAGQVETRPKTAQEIAYTTQNLVFPVDVPSEELTNRTFSLAFDIGIYFAEVLVKNLDDLRWTQLLKSRKSVDFGQPVLVGFGTMHLNPIRVMVTTAYGIAREGYDRYKLRQAYDTWARLKQVST